MKRREMMKLAYLAIVLPMMPGVTQASSENEAPSRGGDIPPGKESLMWIANSATLIYGERDAVLVDTFMTVEQCNGLADAIVASGKSLKAIYVTHGHPDHFFGLKCDWR
jgi:glyoxylase-like metal-dependent hydrolase (beta-lactamase superfamily II)